MYDKERSSRDKDSYPFYYPFVEMPEIKSYIISHVRMEIQGQACFSCFAWGKLKVGMNLALSLAPKAFVCGGGIGDGHRVRLSHRTALAVLDKIHLLSCSVIQVFHVNMRVQDISFLWPKLA